MMIRRYLVVYEDGPNNLSGFAPDVPGCASTGHSLEELRVNLREALEFHLEGLAMDGQAIPAATTRLVEVPEGGFAEWLDVPLPAMAALSA
jgi:predicted RNase H-like HicB family nuclease